MNGRFDELVVALNEADGNGPLFESAISLAIAARSNRSRVIFIGNGGSAGIASHMAADWLKNGKFSALSFSDPALLTCLSNDLGYENVYSLPISRHASGGDLLIAISSSGQSPNILAAVVAAKAASMSVITLSGFAPDNPLRSLGDVNFYVSSDKYGVVEIAHLSILHSILDQVIL